MNHAEDLRQFVCMFSPTDQDRKRQIGTIHSPLLPAQFRPLFPCFSAFFVSFTVMMGTILQYLARNELYHTDFETDGNEQSNYILATMAGVRQNN